VHQNANSCSVIVNDWWVEFRRTLQERKRPVIVLFTAILFMILFCYGGDPKHFDSVFHLEGTSL
jgi:hypothetical protein